MLRKLNKSLASGTPGGALAFSEPEKAQAQIKDIVESAYDHGAELLAPGLVVQGVLSACMEPLFPMIPTTRFITIQPR